MCGYYDVGEESYPPQEVTNENKTNNYPQYDNVNQEEKVANFIAQTSPSKTISKIDLILKGFIFDEESKKWVKVAQSIPDGIRLDFIQTMTPHLTEDVRMGRLDQNQINKIMEFIIEWTVDYLDIVAEDYSLSEEQMTKISLLMWSAVFHTLCRAINGVERDKMYNSLRLGDDFSQYSKQETKKGILDSILPWK